MKPTVSDFHETFGDFGTGHSEQNDTPINEFGAAGYCIAFVKSLDVSVR